MPKNIWLYSALVFSTLSIVSRPGMSQSFEESYPLTSEGTWTLELTNYRGNVEISAQNSNQVDLGYEVGSDSVGVNAEVIGRMIVVRMNDSSIRNSNEYYANFTIRVPVGLKLRITNTSGSTLIDGAIQDIEVSSITGNINVSNALGVVNLDSVSGQIVMQSLGDSSVTAETVTGDISLRNSRMNAGRYNLRSISGNIEILHTAQTSYTLTATTTTGTIESNAGTQYDVDADADFVRRLAELRDGSDDETNGFLRINDPTGGGVLMLGEANNGGASVRAVTVSGDVTVTQN